MKRKQGVGPREREPETRINERIRTPQVRVVADDGEQLGVLPIAQALAAARERGLDLVEVSPNADPPVCKIMDFGKFKYLQKKKQHEAKKKQHHVQIKEVKFRPKIEKHDYEFKLRHAREFLEEGNKVKATVRFRGREITRPELARRIIDRLEEDVKDIGSIEQRPSFEGRTMMAIFAPGAAKPTKPKAKPKAETAKTEKAQSPEGTASGESPA